MPIRDFQSCMLPLLEFSADGVEHSLEEARESLSQRFSLSAAERGDLLPSGGQRRFDNRVAESEEVRFGMILVHLIAISPGRLT